MTQVEKQVILFYKYHPLSGKRAIVEAYRSALESLCQGLQLEGRILVGCNEHQSEGINGTLSGSMENVQTFVHAMCQYHPPESSSSSSTSATPTLSTEHQSVVQIFWKECQQFYANAKCEPLIMTPVEFKWSSKIETEGNLFPDLNIKLVKELIGTGGVLASIPLDEVHQGYLTPKEWHERIAKYKNDQQQNDSQDTVLIDCRNTKEFQIGHFPNSLDPNTTTFNQFPHWVKQHSQTLANKKVLMYCTGTYVFERRSVLERDPNQLFSKPKTKKVLLSTAPSGGIRCEKASAYIRREIPNVQEVKHLKGGIHRYLDEYGKSNDCLWEGKNFVFDGRGAHKASETAGMAADTTLSSSPTTMETTATPTTIAATATPTTKATAHKVVGTCTYCEAPYDTFDPNCMCTVCNEPTLICTKCQPLHTEYHCKNHQHLKDYYFSDLSKFTLERLDDQLSKLQTMLEEIAVGRKYKQKRKTLKKQCDRIMSRVEELRGNDGNSSQSSNQSLKRKRVLTEKKHQRIHLGTHHDPTGTTNCEIIKSAKRRNNVHLQEQKEQQKQKFVRELQSLGLFQPASAYQNRNGIRLPPPCTRVLRTNTKGKWCGKALLPVLQTEFAELSKKERLVEIIQNGLLYLNDAPIVSLEQAESMKLKNMDVISRITHWNEPPVRIPNGDIDVQTIPLPQTVLDEYFSLEQEEVSTAATAAVVIVCDKPSSVPVHPAGPYLSNSLTIMVEAQEGLEPKSLIPCHRIDRVTSGLTICCTNANVSRLIQSRIQEGSVRKQYLAMVQGQFPNSLQQLEGSGPKSNDLAQWEWNQDKKMIQVHGPIETVDPSNGIRKITEKGKPSSSLFRFISYDSQSNTSIISCCPLTGRGHQLRVHLQWLGHPIMDDIQYDGERLDEEESASIMEGYDRV
ncbi:MAG: hypothetical protein SGBAC_003781, partial [Bacillariaceae sp.]